MLINTPTLIRDLSNRMGEFDDSSCFDYRNSRIVDIVRNIFNEYDIVIKSFFCVSIMLAISISLGASVPLSEWSISAGGQNKDFLHSSAVDSNGNLYVSGEIRGSASFGSTLLDSPQFLGMFLSKITPNGELLWSIQPGGEYSGVITKIEIDKDDNIVCTGSYGGSAIFGNTVLDTNGMDYDGIFVAKLDGNGVWLWAKHVASYNSLPTLCLLSVDDSCNVYLSGELIATQEFGTTTLNKDTELKETFIAKMDKNGNWLWAINNTTPATLYCMATDQDSNVYVAGSYVNTDFEASDLYEALFGSEDIYIAKYNSNAELIKVYAFGSSGFDYIRGLAIDFASNVYMIGTTSGEIRFGDLLLTSDGYREVFVSKMNCNGDFLWATRPGGPNARTGKGIAVDEYGSAYIVGSFYDEAKFGTSSVFSNGEEDGFIAKLDSHGNWLWGESIGGQNNDWCTTIAISKNNDIYVGGVFYDSVAIDDAIHSSSGDSDIIVLKLLLE